LVARSPFLAAQESSQHGWYAPLTNSDGLRYPLEIGPLTWHLVGSGIYAVKGSDGLIHLAYALQVTNSWSLPATIKSVELVDPARGNQVSGRNRVLEIKNEDVTGQVKLFTLLGTMNKESYTTQIPSGQSGVMFFDVTYDDMSQVPKATAHRITVTTPPTPVGTEHTTVGHSIPIGREAVVISLSFKGSGEHARVRVGVVAGAFNGFAGAVFGARIYGSCFVQYAETVAVDTPAASPHL
jgi:hypothetical protein